MQQIPGGEDVEFTPVFVNMFEPDAGYKETLKLLDKCDKLPTAIISGSDDYTSGIYRALKEKGLSVPGDISLVSWNDTLTEKDVPFPVDSIHMDFKQAGKLAAGNLLKMIAKPSECVETERIKTELIVRGSVRKI